MFIVHNGHSHLKCSQLSGKQRSMQAFHYWPMAVSLPAAALAITVLSAGRDLNYHASSGAAVELLNSSLAGHSTLTLCARILVKQFWPRFQSPLMDKKFLFTFFAMKEIGNFEEQGKYFVGEEWQNGNILFIDEFGEKKSIDLKPGVWNSLCISLSADRNLYEIWFNGKIVTNYENFDGSQEQPSGNLQIFNYGWFYSALFGSVTDINIWSRNLAGSEVERWSRCEGEAAGDLLDWQTAKWKTTGLGITYYEENVGKSEVCPVKEEIRVKHIFRVMKSFYSSIKLCKSIGGEMLVAENDKTLNEMKELLQGERDQCGDWIYSGYTEREGAAQNI